jgi:apolipoprotein N-acyltransferase
VGFGLFAAIGAAGAVRLANAPEAFVPGISLRLVQGNIPQDEKWDDAARMKILHRYLDLSAAPSTIIPPPAPDGKPPVTVTIWPESAMPFLLDAEPALRHELAGVIAPGGYLFTGAIRANLDDRGPDGRLRQFWNSLQVLDDQGRIVATYDKAHLVPFGEYMPFSQWLPLRGFAASSIDFSTGPGAVSLHLPGIPAVSPLICYEAIFPGDVTSHGDRPRWIVNITNDGWYGRSAGPYQHFAAAAVRAVEEGMPLARAANTGISGVVDSYGRVVASLRLGIPGMLDSPLPNALSEPTLYERLGDSLYFLMLAGLSVGGFLLRRRNFS